MLKVQESLPAVMGLKTAVAVCSAWGLATILSHGPSAGVKFYWMAICIANWFVWKTLTRWEEAIIDKEEGTGGCGEE